MAVNKQLIGYIFFIWAVLLWAAIASGDIIYVDDSATGANNGLSWNNAYNYLQDALNDPCLAYGDEIQVAQGVYKPDQGGGNTPGDHGATFQLIDGVALKGGYAGFGAPDPNTWDFELYETILSGDLNNNDVEVAVEDLFDEPTRSDNSYHVVYSNSNDETAILDGFTITGGNADSSYPKDRGSGMHNYYSSPTISHCIFNWNSAKKGGGMYNMTSSPTVTNCTFNRNFASEDGGGMDSWGICVPVIAKCTFSGNRAFYDGGGMNCDAYSAPVIAKCTFSRNRAFFNGGGINCDEQSTLQITNCTLIGNYASIDGGGMNSYWDSRPEITNCTFTANSSLFGGGGMYYDGAAITNSIFWRNTAAFGPEIHSYATVTVSYSNILATQDSKSRTLEVDWKEGNIDVEPLLTPDGHLRADSLMINAGDSNFTTDPNLSDLDSEDRIIDGRVEIGADEFLDSDSDGLPDFWESLHFESATGAEATADPDNDGLTNLKEYEVFGSDPSTDPIYVDVDNPADPSEDGSSDHPFDTIQEGLDAADDGDTVLVADGDYTGSGNKELDFAGKSIILRSISGASLTTIDCDESGRAFDFDDGETAGAAVIGFEITNGQAGYGGAIKCTYSHPQFHNCRITSNTATNLGGGIYSTYSTPTLSDCVISNNEPNAVWTFNGGARIEETVQLISNNWLGQNVILSGNGIMHIDSNSIIGLGNGIDSNSIIGLDDARIRCDLSGTGTVKVDLGTELVIEGEAVVNLTDPNESDKNGRIQCEGLLRVKDNVQISNTNIIVNRASFEGDVNISNSVITAEAGLPYGQFFIQDSVTIAGNDIHANGDRYMDLDPSVFAGVIANNKIYVTITEGVGSSRGGLLELRGRDLEFPPCDPNSFFCQLDDVPDFDPNTWTLEKLKIIEGAKVNLTNRFNFGNGDLNEVIYTKKLIMEPGSVLNTSFNRLYYDNKDIDETAVIKNIPLLGFSLVNIAFDDENEFLTRVVHTPSFIDPNRCEPDYSRIHVERVTEGPDPAGMMHMCTLEDEDEKSLTYRYLFNARAKGLFAKSSEDEILIWFEYLFETSHPDVELVIYLTDVPELMSHSDPCRAEHYIEVARLLPPLEGQPGSERSNRFGTFKKYVSRGDLDFIRGTRIEFELIGPDGSCVLINNWDPQVHCSATCKDVTGDNAVTVRDFLTVVGECGTTAELIEGENNSRTCLDGIFSDDGYVDWGDVTSWDWTLTLNPEDRLNLCDPTIPLTDETSKSACGSCPPAKSAPMVPMPSLGPVNLETFDGALLVAGKVYDPYEPDHLLRFLTDGLYGLDEYGHFMERFEPAFNRTNGRLVKDSAGVLYQLNLEQGLVRLDDEAEVVIPNDEDAVIEPRYGVSADVYVGLQGSSGNWWGRPIMDVAFDPCGFAYVVPVVVAPVGQDPNLAYTAAAKLQLTGGSPPYEVLQLYDDPNAASPRDNRELTGLREIEVDSDGYVYIANVHSINESDILWIYNADTGQMQARLPFTDPNNNGGIYIPAPIGMHVSGTTDMLYLASSQNDPAADSTLLYAISTAELALYPAQQLSVQTIEINGMGHVTDITDDPATGTLWVLGSRMQDIPYKPGPDKPLFYKPYIAQIPIGSNSVEAICISDPNSEPENDLALPLSIVWMGKEGPLGDCEIADISGTGSVVNLVDFAVIFRRWLDSDCAPVEWCEGADIDKSGVVDLADLVAIARCWL